MKKYKKSDEMTKKKSDDFFAKKYKSDDFFSKNQMKKFQKNPKIRFMFSSTKKSDETPS